MILKRFVLLLAIAGTVLVLESVDAAVRDSTPGVHLSTRIRTKWRCLCTIQQLQTTYQPTPVSDNQHHDSPDMSPSRNDNSSPDHLSAGDRTCNIADNDSAGTLSN
ncbi:hypothetical protein pipiens_001856 [Culex pipiens pipiens]|uniref:Secreted protein n=1 Tax=Culex pipiens pipiens TaxID=38569 RepID=A0ABD1DVU4_CULPP